MITEAITTAAEYMAALGLDAVKERVHAKLDESKLRTELINYIERQRKYNEMCTMAEEIDFQGLVEYIQNSLLKQAGVRIFDPNSKKRGHARQVIVDAAVACSKANTKESKTRVAKCISICLDIIRRFYEQHHFSVFCKCKFLKFADKNGEFCISVLEKVAGCPAGLPDAS